MSFRPTTAYYAGGQFGNGVAIADVNADGKPDLIVTNGYDGAIAGNGGVGVLLGNGDGTFQPAITYDTGGSGSFAMTIAVADFNNDGKLDLAVTNSCGDSYCGFANGSVAMLLGNGDGTFRTAVNYQTGGQSWSVKTADLNRDGKPDLLVGNSDGSVAVLLGNGNGTFLPAVGYQSHGIASNSIDVADLDGDGRLDLIVADYCSLTCTWRRHFSAGSNLSRRGRSI